MTTNPMSPFPQSHTHKSITKIGCCTLLACAATPREAVTPAAQTTSSSGSASAITRERISLNDAWRFYKYPSSENADDLIYDVRPEVVDGEDDRPADARPTQAVAAHSSARVLKPWILPTGNAFMGDPKHHHRRPAGSPGSDFALVQADYDDSGWEQVRLPHDWAIREPFMAGAEAEVGGGMGRLPSPGIAWYRRTLHVPSADAGKSIFLDVDGAMAYAMVWLNGTLVGGWPYGYASWRLDLTPHLTPGTDHQLAIRLDNPPHSSRWYPGGGLYRNVWLTKAHAVHVGHWGTFMVSHDVSDEAATLELEVTIDNDTNRTQQVEATTRVYTLNLSGERGTEAVAHFEPQVTKIPTRKSARITGRVTLENPRLWGPPPTQTPHRYVAITTLSLEGQAIDTYETRFGIRSLRFDANQGLFVNGEHIYIKGVNQHHDLGALGAAFNMRAAERQLEMLKEMGCNALRMAHNPPAPELLELTDRMGFLVINESFDAWALKKPPLDFHLIFPDWHEQDMRALVRRDRNHPSVIMWSIGNEVGEQYTAEHGAEVANKLHDIARQEDPTRPTTASMNYAKPHMQMPQATDVITLNYQGEGIRDAPLYAHLEGIKTSPLYPAFHQAFPEKLIISSENAAALSSRGEYLFPVVEGDSAPVENGRGGDPERRHVSAYELYTAPFGSSPDKVFRSLDRHPYVAGGFVWSGWDYLGEPTPYYLSRSSYFGIIDLAGFKKDRFYLYQTRWRPELPVVHILPHWTWPERVGKVTPIHVFTSGDAAELFVNDVSQGRKQKGVLEYRLRWDEVVYQPGEVRVVAYKDGKKWAEQRVKTAAAPNALTASADRNEIAADGADLSFVTVRVTDASGLTAPRANNVLAFRISGPGELVATDNGDPTDLTPFSAHARAAFNGLCLVIVRAIPHQPGEIRITAESDTLTPASVSILSKRDPS